ncbi:hypothetical protein Tco_0535166 [Tanacetum coccineum]
MFILRNVLDAMNACPVVLEMFDFIDYFNMSRQTATSGLTDPPHGCLAKSLHSGLIKPSRSDLSVFPRSGLIVKPDSDLVSNNMANENVPAPTPTRSDDQILPFAAWVPIGKNENWFILDTNLLRESLEITPIDQAHQFVSPSLGDAIMDFVNELGYTEEIHFVSRMAVNNLYQPWRAILSMIS